jgi:hypothetical protein
MQVHRHVGHWIFPTRRVHLNGFFPLAPHLYNFNRSSSIRQSICKMIYFNCTRTLIRRGHGGQSVSPLIRAGDACTTDAGKTYHSEFPCLFHKACAWRAEYIKAGCLSSFSLQSCSPLSCSNWTSPRCILSIEHFEDPKMQLLALTLLATSAVVTANQNAWVTYFDNLVTFGDRLGDISHWELNF